MFRQMIARIAVGSVTAIAIGACSEASPAGPSATSAEAPILAARAALGQYDLHFDYDVELVLIATVRDAGGAPAEGGTAAFQYCSTGRPRGDETDPDETSSSECANGTGSWINLGRSSVDADGQAHYVFGSISVVDVIGFRYKYTGQGSGIASFTTAGEDWVR
jgi:hypothetical protein